MITVFIDGACEPFNPGGYGACAFAAFEGAVSGGKDDPRPKPLKQAALILGNGNGMTNNVAEWRALRGTLQWLSQNTKPQPIALFMDSQLVVNQFTEKWQCNVPALYALREECRKLWRSEMILTWIPREQNWVADDLINRLYASKGIKVTVRPRKTKT